MPSRRRFFGSLLGLGTVSAFPASKHLAEIAEVQAAVDKLRASMEKPIVFDGDKRELARSVAQELPSMLRQYGVR